MCGICGYLGVKPGIDMSLDGIQQLRNRGYDSCGVCSINKTGHLKGNLVINKYANKQNISSFDLLMKDRDVHNDYTNMISHCRWATHGAKTDINAHPHIDFTGKISLVHNGIIENYDELKLMLINNYNIRFTSQTDTEVIVNMISVYYKQFGHLEEAIKETVNKLQGTWALVVICTDKPDNMYCARHGSPLLIGFGGDYIIVSSETSGFCNNINNYICLEDGDTVVLKRRDGKVFFQEKGKYAQYKVQLKDIEIKPDPYAHWTIKEIYEQPESITRAINMGGRILNDREVKLGGLDKHKQRLLETEHLIILGCGTSYHAGLYSTHTFKELCDFTTVQAFDGAEFSENDIPKKGRSVFLFLSQSGETRDLHHCIYLGKKLGIIMIGVVNVVDSWISREVDCGVYLNAGREVGVASTKAFTSQVVVLSLIAIWFSQYRDTNLIKRMRYIKDIRQLSHNIQHTIKDTHDICKDIAKFLEKKQSCFVLGKMINKSIALEGALKLKEIGYIHTEGVGDSLRHGPYALCGEDVPVIFITPNDENFTKINNTVNEVISRDVVPIGISDIELGKLYKYRLKTAENESFRNLLSVIPLQLIAYELGVIKGHNPDYPRNLAKSVTV